MKAKSALQAIIIMAVVFLCASGAYAFGEWELMQSGTKQELNSVSGLSDGTVYAVGKKGTIIKYDGSVWSPEESGTTRKLNNVWAAGATTLYAVGDYRSILMRNGGSWDTIHSVAKKTPLYGIGGPDADNGKIIAVGKSNTFRQSKGVRYYHNILDGSETSFRSQPQYEYSNDLYGAFYSAADQNVLIVGSKGIIGWYAGYDSSGHNVMETWDSPVSKTLRAIWAVDSQNFFAVGDRGIIVRKLNDGSINTMTSNTRANLRAVWGTDMNNVYAVGAKGTLMHFDGIVWSKIPVPTKAHLNGIWGVSEGEIYAVGSKGTIIKYVGNQKCFCPDGTISVQNFKEDEPGFEKCQCAYYSVWCDPATDICWQDPQKDYLTPDYPGIVSYDAERYCEELVALGYDDWSLPDIDQLRSLIRGNPDTEYPSGSCPMWTGSSLEDGQDRSCGGLPDGEGPGIEGCYWPDVLNGSCHRPDPATHGIHPLEYWAVGAASNTADWIASALFDIGAVTYNHINSLGEVRCIRKEPTVPILCDETPSIEACMPSTTRECSATNGKTGAQVCSASGDCWSPCESTSFDPTPPSADVCNQCEQMILTINVPEELPAPPTQIMAFWYKSEGWTGLPMGPPTGGTDDNVILNPDIALGKPYIMTLPSCTYYRENCLSGDYQLFVGLYLSDDFPPLLKDGDYNWGVDLFEEGRFTLGGDSQQIRYFELTLEKCVGGSCDY